MSEPRLSDQKPTEKKRQFLSLQDIHRFFQATIKNPYETLEKPARTVKALAQMLVGVLLVVSVGAQLKAVVQPGQGIADFWARFCGHNLLDTIADAILVATAIELGYMLFTDGPDEAINSPILALAAAILFRIPDALATPEDGLRRSIEIVAYGLILTVLVLVRARFLESEAKRKEIETQAKQAKLNQ